MSKRIWIVNYYIDVPGVETHPRYTQFAKAFMEKGWEVTTFIASYKADEASKEFVAGQHFLRKQYGEYDYVHVRVPHYTGNGLARMKSIFVFAWTIQKYCKQFERPDVILHNVHAPFDAPIVFAAKKLKCKYISEVWDLWPDNFVNFGMVSHNNPAMLLFYRIERWIYEHADERVFTLAGAANYLQKKKWTTDNGGNIDLSHVHYINNGIDIQSFDKERITWPRNDQDLNDPNILKVIYMGSISKANNIHALIEAARMLLVNERYRFFIYGDGSDREELEKKVREEGITNVVFKEKHIPLCECAWVVSQATVNVMNYQKGFGYVGVSAGKLFQYLAAGKPIVCNVNIAYDDVITDNNLGIARDIETPEEFAQAIRSVAEQPRANYDAMCERVRQTAERFDYKKLAAEEIKVIETALQG